LFLVFAQYSQKSRGYTSETITSAFAAQEEPKSKSAEQPWDGRLASGIGNAWQRRLGGRGAVAGGGGSGFLVRTDSDKDQRDQNRNPANNSDGGGKAKPGFEGNGGGRGEGAEAYKQKDQSENAHDGHEGGALRPFGNFRLDAGEERSGREQSLEHQRRLISPMI
jgi:hypothetical protein